MNMLTILNRSGIMYRFASEFESLVLLMSSQTGHGSPDKIKELYYNDRYRYQFAYRIAGFWHVTEVWCNDDPRRTPEEMAEIMTQITSSSGKFQIL